MGHGGNPNAEGESRRKIAGGPHRIDVPSEDLETILEHAKAALSEKEFATLKGAMQTLEFLTRELEKKSVSVQRLRQMLFGAATETTAKVLKKILDETLKGQAAVNPAPAAQAQAAGTGEKPKGHGRNGADAYTGARRIRVPLGSLHAGDACPSCTKGTVYASCAPGLIVRLTGQAPIAGAVYELEKLRCSLCGEVFCAQAPAGVGPEKYDAESAAMIGLLKYGTGLPFHRLEGLQEGLGIPLPAATQWEIVAQTAGILAPALEEMIRQAAQGEILYNDDTTMTVLTLGSAAEQAHVFAPDVSTAASVNCVAGPVAGATEPAPSPAQSAAPAAAQAAGDPGPVDPAGEASALRPVEGHIAPEQAPGRRGVFTSGIISKAVDHVIALFFTGHKHAGENLLDLLRQRALELGPPIQMCDALSRNMPPELRTILANCLAHGRRKFVDLAGNFPDECIHVLQILKVVYGNETIARDRKMSAQQRLLFHQAHSGPAMAELATWMQQQIEQKKVEPNSGLGEAIAYMRKHWKELTLFLRAAGAPLDNNVCERALKKVILHRKNAYFYKTENGARVGDLFMSLIHTCELNGANPFHYLTELQKHARELAAAPADWMPWNYLATLASAQNHQSG